MPNKRWAGLGLSLSKKRESEKTETKLRASSETIFKLVTRATLRLRESIFDLDTVFDI